jgi:intracellular multiplication protein IcmK
MPGFSGGIAPASSAEMQAEMEAQAEDQRVRLRQEAFKQALQGLLPLKPEEIREVLGMFKESRQAAETPIVYPEPKIHVQNVSLDPSVVPPIIKLMPGHVTTITLLDMTGEPWPIQDISFAGAFDVTPPESGGHVIRVVPRMAHGIGNMSIRLVDLITPITFSLRTDLGETYYRVDARIPKYGPLAKAPIIEHGGLSAQAGGETLMQVLEGTPPPEAARLSVSGDDGRTRAWKIKERVYVRTPLTLLSPTWDSSVRSADGMSVYTLASAPVLLLSDNGRMVRAVIREDVAEADETGTDGVNDGQ